MATDRRPRGTPACLVVIGVLLTFVVSACGDSSYVTGAQEKEGELLLTPAEATMMNGDVVTFQVALRRPDGVIAPVTGPVAWSVSNDSVARITEPGKALALLPGSVTIVAHAGSGTATAGLTIFPRLEDLTLSLAATSVVGDAGQDEPIELEARVLDVRSVPVPGVEVSFETDGPAGAISPSTGFTDDDGWFRAQWTPGERAGQYEIAVSTPGLSEAQMGSSGPSDGAQARIVRSIQASVRPGQMAEVNVSPEQESVAVGQVRSLSAEVVDRFGNTIEGVDFTWSSSDPSVASVDQAGRVRGERVGEVTIEVRPAGPGGSAGSLTAQVEVTVREEGSPQAPLSIRGGQGQSATVGSELPRAMEVQVRDPSGAPVAGVTVTWQIVQGSGTLSPEAVMTNAQGVAASVLTLGTAAGPRKVAASASGMDPVIFEVVAHPGPVSSVLVSPSAAVVQPDKELQLAATVMDEYANVISGQTVTWSSSEPDIASVGSGGRVRGRALGTAIVAASIGNAIGSANVEVRTEPGNGGDKDENGGGENGGNGDLPIPERVKDLKVVGQGADSLVVAFTEVADGAGGPARYEIRHHPSPLNTKWEQATPVSSGTCKAPFIGQAVGSERRCSIRGLQASKDIDVQLVAYREVQNGSKVHGELSNVASGRTADAPVILGTLTITPSSLNFTGTGASTQLQVAAKSALGAQLSNVTVDWKSVNPAIATVTSSGLVHATGTGSTRVIASAGCCEPDTITVNIAPPPSTSGPVPAFPGAEGWGASALNASRKLPLRVHSVTSREAAGPGTLAEAFSKTSSSHFDVIIFRTGGVFQQPSGGFRLNSSHVYVAGQTAPGDGVTIDGSGRDVTIWIRGSGANISDLVFRYMRIREPRTGVSVAKGSRIVFDHMSFSWARRYLFQIIYQPDRSYSDVISSVSLQNSILAEVLDEHPTAMTIGAGGDLKSGLPAEVGDISVHRNLFANNDRRNPLVSADFALIANNVIYNWRQGATQSSQSGAHDYVNNFGKAGPMGLRDHVYIVNLHCNRDDPNFSIYAAGNIGPASQNPHGDNWFGDTRQVACYRNTEGAGEPPGATPPLEWRRSPHQPLGWLNAQFPVTIRTAAQAYEAVLSNVGANRRLECDGTWADVQDAVDARVISQARNGNGPSRAPTSPGAWPNYRSGTPCQDSDGDGLPDTWEQRYFGCITCADPAAVGRAGYLVIEHYLNGTSPK